jgi:hypothetical protein
MEASVYRYYWFGFPGPKSDAILGSGGSWHSPHLRVTPG